MEMHNYVVTHQRKARPSKANILAKGVRCRSIVKSLYDQLKAGQRTDSDLTLTNRVEKIYRMLLNSKDDDIYITKFTSPIWGKQDDFSKFGECFLSFSNLLEWFPYMERHKHKAIAKRKPSKFHEELDQ